MSQTLINGPITAAIISERISFVGENRECGAHSIFLGQVRPDIVDGKKVEAIEYSAYAKMVEEETGSIKGQIYSGYGDIHSVEILHSVGIVKAGEISLFVMVSGGHRDQATTGCRQAVELIKDRLPVWKKELFEDDTYRWKENEK